MSSAELCNVWKLREVRMRSSFGRGEERDVDRTDSSGEGGTVASEKRTVVGVADERTVCEESSIGLRGPGGGGGGGAVGCLATLQLDCGLPGAQELVCLLHCQTATRKPILVRFEALSYTKPSLIRFGKL